MNTLNTADVEVTDILEELDRLRAVNKQLKDALQNLVKRYPSNVGMNAAREALRAANGDITVGEIVRASLNMTVGEIIRAQLKAAS
jgi:hypothetical protein